MIRNSTRLTLIFVALILLFTLCSPKAYSGRRQGKSEKKQHEHPLNNITFATSTLVWISSIEDLAVHFVHTARYWRKARLHDRTLTVITYSHEMYGGNEINFCNIFKPPPGLFCLSAPRADIVANKTCMRAPMDIDADTMKPAKKYLVPSTYGLPVLVDINSMSEVDWRTSECVIGSADSRYFIKDQDWSFPVVFSGEANLLFRKVQYLLSLDRDRPYAAIRWERYNFATRCKKYWALRKMHENNEENMKLISSEELRMTCSPAKNLVSVIRQKSDEKAVYVSTNEVDQESLEILSRAGYKLLKKSSLILDELQSIIVDLQMMAAASTFLSWEIGSLAVFVHMYRFQRHEDEHILRESKNAMNLFEWAAFLAKCFCVFGLFVGAVLSWYYYRKSKLVAAARYSRLTAAPYTSIED